MIFQVLGHTGVRALLEGERDSTGYSHIKGGGSAKAYAARIRIFGKLLDELLMLKDIHACSDRLELHFQVQR